MCVVRITSTFNYRKLIMTRTHFVSKTVISANTFDLADHIQAMPNIEMQDHLLRGLVNDTDFLIKSAVYAAYKFVRAEVLDVSNATFVEIANAVKELELAELSFFEAGSTNPSVIDTVKHLNELREVWIEAAKEANALVEGSRSTVSSLWAQANDRTYKPQSIQDQFLKPTGKVTKTVERRVKVSVKKLAAAYNQDADYVTAKTAERLVQQQQRVNDMTERMTDMAPIYIALFDNILSTDTSVFNEIECRGDGYSTEGKPDRKVWVASIEFCTLPYAVRAVLIEKAMKNADTFRGWQLGKNISDDEFNVIDMTTDKFIAELEGVLKSPQFRTAARVAEAGA